VTRTRHLFIALFAALPAHCTLALQFDGAITPEAVALVRERHRAGLYEPPERARPLDVVPVTFHAVRDSQGRYTNLNAIGMDQRIVDAVAFLNEHFGESGMQFCQAGPTLYIDDDFWAEWRPGATFDELLQIGRVEGTVNVYLFPKPTTVLVKVAFTWSPIQSIGINFSQFITTADTTTFTEVVGHYFDLFRTNETAFGIECASGANCESAGDLVCDTPTDRGAGLLVSCEWTQPPPYQGPCPGDPMYTPDKYNIMAPQDRHCVDHLTQGQQDRAYATLVNIRHELDLTMCACPADCNLDGYLDIRDYFCFLDAFIEEEPYACDMSTTGARVCDIFDFLAFQDAFVAGCP